MEPENDGLEDDFPLHLAVMFQIQGRLRTIRKEAIRKWESNPSNAYSERDLDVILQSPLSGIRATFFVKLVQENALFGPNSSQFELCCSVDCF